MKRIRLLLAIALMLTTVMGATAPLAWSQERLPPQGAKGVKGVCTAQAHGGNAPGPPAPDDCAIIEPPE
jgi:hypothetical protein